MNLSYSQFVGIGAVLMLVPMLYAGRVRGITIPKILLCGLGFTAGGILGVNLMYLIETGIWGGRSFFGALFIAPLCAFLLAKVLRLKFADVSDLCPSAISAILALLKFKCYQDGCCYGIVLSVDDAGRAVRYPSQLVEMGTALVLMIVFVILVRTGLMKGGLYGLYMLVYGVLRYYLNTKRETHPFVLGMAAGNFWAIISAVCGLAWMVIWFLRRRAKSQAERQTGFKRA